MADPVIIETETGAQYSVVESEFKKHYPDVKYKVLGEEKPSDFVVTGIPAPKRPGSARIKKLAAKATAAPAPEPTAE
jgi:hypothetical protein